MSVPNFSIIVPTYNQQDYLGACLDSIIAQTDGDWEAVVINDGSTDGTAELADGYARRDSRIRVFHKSNGGVASALNEGLKRARGRWINWLSSDDLFDPKKLEINRQAISEFPDCKFFFSYFRLLRQSTQELTDHGLWGPLPDRELQLSTLFFRNYISGITICIERAAWMSVGLFDESLRYAQDYDMWLRLLRKFPARFLPQWTVTNRNHALQGSEIFAEACYYDTAKAAILFLNKTSFAELFPLLDLTDPDQAERALESALTMAGERSAFLYALGWQPGLLWRTMEWIFETEQRDKGLGRRLRVKARWLCRRAARSLEPGPASIWKTVQSALAIDGMQTHFEAVDPVNVALNRHAHLASVADPAARSFADYLKQFHGIGVPNARLATMAGKDIAIIIESKASPDDLLGPVRPLIREMTQRGWYVSVFAEGAPACRFDGEIPVVVAALPSIIRAAKGFRHRCVLTSDVVSAKFPADFLVLPASGVAHVETLANVIANISGLITPASQSSKSAGGRIPLVFLTRSLHGGGAEKVLYDLVHALDQSRFSVTVVPLFESEHSPVFTKGIVTESFQVVAERSALVVLAVEPHVDAPIETPAANPLPSFATKLASKLRPDQLDRIKSIPLFPAAKFVLRTITSGYRKARYGGWNQRLFSPESPIRNANGAVPADADFVPALNLPHDCDDGTEEHDAHLVAIPYLRQYRRMSHFVSDIVRRLGDRAIVVAVMEEATIVAWMASLRAPFRYVAWLHTVESLYLRQLFPKDAERHSHDILLHTAVARAESCVFPSQGCCDDLMLLYGLPGHHFRTIYNPIDLTALRALAAEAPEAPVDLDSTVPVIVSLGRLSPEKGHDALLGALQLLLQRHRKFLCLVIGTGEMSTAILDMVRRYGLEDNVRMLGAAKNPFPYLVKAGVLVLASRFEAFALVLVEAMALGVTAVSVDCPTGPREVLDHGRAGILVPPGDVSALAEAIEKALWLGANDGKTRAHASEWVKTFDIPTVSRQWEQLLAGVDAKRARSVPPAL